MDLESEGNFLDAKQKGKEDSEKWYYHSERQLSAAKAGVLAVTVLNSGSWLALLTQVGSLQDQSIGSVLGAWGLGALLGTSIWLFVYCNTIHMMDHDFDRTNETISKRMNRGIRTGLAVASLSLLCFALGVVMLARAFI